MLIGRVLEVSAAHPDAAALKKGDRIATLVSLTLTPLVIDEVKAVHPAIDRVDVKGRALLFASGIYARLPDDLPDTLSLAALDVAGAPALIARYAKPGMTVMLLGAGKSGALCLAQARRSIKGQGKLLALDVSRPALDALKGIGLCDEAIACDATKGVEVMEQVAAATGGQLADLVINCASVPNTEMAAILSAREGGTVIFFSMATSFTERGAGRRGRGQGRHHGDRQRLLPGHADLTLDLLAERAEAARALRAALRGEALTAVRASRGRRPARRGRRRPAPTRCRAGCRRRRDR